MLVEVESPVSGLRDWVRSADTNAAHRMPLLERAERIISGRELAGNAVRERLAEQLERWRYQHLEWARRHPNPLGCRLAETLDLMARRLMRRSPSRPRGARTALEDTFNTPIEVRRAWECLNRQVPLETVIQRAKRVTAEAFGPSRAVLLYAPLYLSSHCVNFCTYCAFRYPNELPRKHLSAQQAVEQAAVLRSRGLRHLLLVAGDYPQLTSPEYVVEIVRAVSQLGLAPALEIAPQTTSSYAALVNAGACGVTLYHEVYNESRYVEYHPRGSKRAYDWRLEGLERAAEAGVTRLGLGILLGLGEPREELAALVRHGVYLRDRHPDCTLAFSLPRIHEAPNGFHIPHAVNDETFIRMYCALRVAFPAATLVLSTRERAELRNRLAHVCITQLSAGSSTVPGGYENGVGAAECGGQFPVHDTRSVEEMARWVESAGLALRWT
jgi:2-iminoacetate synthase